MSHPPDPTSGAPNSRAALFFAWCRGVRLLGASVLVVLVLGAAACASSTPPDAGTQAEATTAVRATSEPVEAPTPDTPGGYDFDRSDRVAGIANITAAFGTDETTASCIYDAWGDVANVPPEQLTPELMTFPICGTSIFQLMTGDPRFTGSAGDS